MYKLNLRKAILMLADIFIVSISGILSNFLLSLVGCEVLTSKVLLYTTVLNVIFCFLLLSLSSAYKIMWRYFNIKDYLVCIRGIVLGIVFGFSIMRIFGHALTVPFIICDFIILTIGITLFRFIFKDAFLTISDASKSDSKKRTMIVGGGQACKLILKELENAKHDSNNPSNEYNPICVVDDNREFTGKEIYGVQIKGTTHEINQICKKEKIELIIFAIPSCDEDERKRILDICSETKLPIKVIPYLGHMIFDDDTNILSQIKDIKIEDLLGRDPISFDKEEIRDFISDQVCLITGGGGSIGSELTRQIAKYLPKQIIIVDIYENNAYEIQQELVMEYGDSLNLVTLIASVRDYDRMNQILRTYKPDVVFHAAAHKHVPLMEVSPMESVKNNIMGTFNMATLSDYYHVKKFVMISTDKAVNPTNVMGASKRCCEMIVQYMAQLPETTTQFVTTRFGNVLGSNGSVIPLFRKQIESGRAITVTHPDIIRYFMTIPEAVSLVLQAGAMAHGGEIFVLDMGAPVKITSLAENLIRMYGKVPYKDVEIHFTGLRPGEKLFEELLMDEEGLKKTANKKIFIGNQIDIDPAQFIDKLAVLKSVALTNDEVATVECLADIVPTFKRSSEMTGAVAV